MTVLCANCHTANRDRAMFCRGCAGKLPAFAATGPSALQALGASTAAPQAKPPAAAVDGRASALVRSPRGLVLAVLLLGAAVLALTAWISFGPERSSAPGIASAAAPPTALPATPVAAPAPVPASATLSPGETMVVDPAVRPAAPLASASAPTQTPTAAAPSAAEPVEVGTRNGNSPTATPVGPSQRVASVNASRASPRGAADPRAGCEHLFFVLAARCEANHCDEAAYSRHPRCTLVREQRQRDEARRNLYN